MPNGNSSDQWFLEVNGKKFGPYTMAQINALVQHHEIVGEDRVTAPHLSGKWISVQEFVNQNGPANTPKKAASAPAAVPPRPDERTLTSITTPLHHSPNEKRDSGSKAILNLFEILQAARERKPQTPAAVGHQVVEMPRPVKTSSGGGLFWLAVPALAVAAVITWKMMGSSSTPATSVAETETPSKTAKQAQRSAVAAAAPVAPPRAAAPVAPPARPRTTASLPTGFAAGRQQIRPTQPLVSDRDRDRELDREREREKERESERELERERERDAEYSRNYSTNELSPREKEREREREAERDQRLNPDQQKGVTTAGAGTSAGNQDSNILPVTGGTPVDPSALYREPSSDADPSRASN